MRYTWLFYEECWKKLSLVQEQQDYPELTIRAELAMFELTGSGSLMGITIWVTFPAFLLTEPHCTVYEPSGNKGLVYFYTYLKDLLSGTASN